jgi:hypothetical protein
MLKIVEVHPAPNAQGEYVVLQNCGLVTVSLRGWAICTDAYLNGDAQSVGAGMYVFRADVPINSYTRVVLFTGYGEDGWVPTVDGKKAYCASWGRAQSIWTNAENVYVLQIAASKRVVQPGAVVSPLATYPMSKTEMQAEETDRQASYADVNAREAVR